MDSKPLRLIVWLLAGTMVCLLSLDARAGTAAQLGVEKVRSHNLNGGSIGLITFTGQPVEQPACAANSANPTHIRSMSVDLNTSWGRAAFSLALAAHLVDHKLRVVGTDSCDHIADVEGWSWGHITKP